MAMSKMNYFINNFIDSQGKSSLIEGKCLRDDMRRLGADSIFRSDGDLAKKFKFYRFCQNTNNLEYFTHASNCWKDIGMTDEEKRMIRQLHSSLTWERRGTTIQYVKFFGQVEESIVSYPPLRQDLIDLMTAPGRCCDSCGTVENLQCDHRNDLYNDPRMFNMAEQTEDDVQTLCGSCNSSKARAKQKMLAEDKRQPPPFNRYREGVYGVKYTEGNDTLDQNDPNWYKGTYWGGCLDYIKKTTIGAGQLTM
jgi:5-methylcytosine-specific restriction endonuclease McrA